MATKFTTEENSTYLEEAAEYLAARGFPANCPIHIQPFAAKNMGLENEDGTDFTPEGWAFVMKGPDGQPIEGMYHIRVCNYPQTPLYVQDRKGKVQGIKRQRWNKDEDRPKFLQGFKEEFLYYASRLNELCHSPVITLHEKITSAELALMYLGTPSVAVSGCAGWLKNHKMGAQLKFLIENLKQDCKMLVCFDGDLRNKEGIQEAARGLKSWVKELRPDIHVVFPEVPENEQGVGWDDWCVAQGSNAAAAWAQEILNQGDGVEITDFAPSTLLIEQYQLTFKQTRGGDIVPEHTAENYTRLMRYPKWRALAMDIGGEIYNGDDVLAGSVRFEGLVYAYRRWLESGPFRDDAEAVRTNHAKDAITDLLTRNKISVPLELLAIQEEVSEDQAKEAAMRLITKGINVTGPMDKDQTAETIIRMARDMVAMWSLDPSVDVQWCCALVGPSGCGKSNFPKSFVGCLADWGYSATVAQLPKEGAKAELPELYKACRDVTIGVFDEYNPDDSYAKQLEQTIFTLSTTRKSKARQLYKEYSEEFLRHASIFLTTVDTNRTYIKSSKGAGERRFITLEVEGVRYHDDGKLTSDRAVVKECGAILLRYGYQLFMAGDTRAATEFSTLTTGDYVSEAAVVGRVGQLWSTIGQDIGRALSKFKEVYYRETTGDVRFSMPMMYNLLMPDERLNRWEKADLKQFVKDCGAECMGKNRVNGPNGREVMKDEVWAIANWEAWCEALIAKI